MNWSTNNFHRTIIFSNVQLSGYYRFKDIFQIRNGEKNWPLRFSGLFPNKPIVLEYDSSYYHFKSLNQNHPNSIEKEIMEEPFRHFDFKKELFALLTLTGNANFFEDQNYFLNLRKLGKNYFKGDFTESNIGQSINLGNKNFNEKYNYSSQQLSLPTDIDLFFSNYFALEENHLARFRMSLMLYYNSIDIRKYSPSMSFVALISAIENLVDYEGKINNFKVETCSSCGQKKYKVSKRFRDFMIKYGKNDDKEFDKYLKNIYSLRSEIAHMGELLYNDFANTEYDYNGDNELNTLKLYVRIALFNWIIQLDK